MSSLTYPIITRIVLSRVALRTEILFRIPSYWIFLRNKSIPLSLLTHPIVTRIFHSRVALRKDSPSHCPRHFSGQKSLEFFHIMDPYKPQLNQADDQQTAAVATPICMSCTYCTVISASRTNLEKSRCLD